jgi:hypothetical protein
MIRNGYVSFFDIRDKCQKTKCNRHHPEAEDLNGFAADSIHRQRGDGISGRREDGEDAKLCEGFLQNRVIAAEGREY